MWHPDLGKDELVFAVATFGLQVIRCGLNCLVAVRVSALTHVPGCSSSANSSSVM